MLWNFGINLIFVLWVIFTIFQCFSLKSTKFDVSINTLHKRQRLRSSRFLAVSSILDRNTSNHRERVKELLSFLGMLSFFEISIDVLSQ